MNIGVIVLIVVLVAIVLLVIAAYNSLVAARNRVKQEWSGIDVQLERRFDLIPNLVETVKGYAKHESETLTKLTELRTSWGEAKTVGEKGKLNSELSKSLSSVYAVIENYPDLKASENFLQLQLELSNTEEKIAGSRNSYNTAVNEYNTKIDVIPTNIIAGLFHFEKSELFEVENEEARKNVKVSF